MLKKPPDFGGLTHKIRKIVFSYFRCPVFAFLVSRLNNADPKQLEAAHRLSMVFSDTDIVSIFRTLGFKSL